MYFKTIPILGFKDDVPADDLSLVKMAGTRTALTHDTGGQNVDYERQRNSCTKALGWSYWDNSSASGSICSGMFELDDGTNRDHLLFMDETAFYYDGSKDPVEVTALYLSYNTLTSGPVAAGETVTGDTSTETATVVTGISATPGTLYIENPSGNFQAENLTFSGGAAAVCTGVQTAIALQETAGQKYSIIQYGSYVIFADAGNSTPLKWQNGDPNLTNLITGTNATLYKFKFLAEWYLHIIGLYSDQTNGDVDIRWTEQLPGSNVTFPAANQIYKPGRDKIVGVSKLGANILLVYGTDSISKMDYYPNSTPVFGITTLVDGQGAASNASIVNAYGANWFYNKNYGFVRYSGGSRISYDDVISRDIDDFLSAMSTDEFDLIVGRALPRTDQIVWSLPKTGSVSRYLVFYNVGTGVWTVSGDQSVGIRHIDAWTLASGGHKTLVMATTLSRISSNTGETDVGGAAWDGYRIEPAMYFGDAKKKKFLKSIWFGIVDGGSYYLDVYHRSGETLKELEGESWLWIGSLSLDDPEVPAIYMPSVVSHVSYDNLAAGSFAIGDTITGATNGYTATVLCNVPTTTSTGVLYLSDLTGLLENNEEIENGSSVTADCVNTSETVTRKGTARYHQIKWGTDEEDEKFSINRIDYEYEIGGNY